MLIALAIVFLTLIVALCVKSSKYNKLKQKNYKLEMYLYELCKEGKISNRDYNLLVFPDGVRNYYKPQPYQNASQQPVYQINMAQNQNGPFYQPQPNVAQPIHTPIMSEQPAPIINSTPTYQQPPQPVSNPMPLYQQQIQPVVKKEKAPFNAVNFILIIGVIFVILAGFIFATTTWSILPNITKVISVSSICLLFFGVSLIAEKKLKVRNTAIAFYTLGSVFIPITIIGLGFFKLFGTWFSLFGNGKFLLYFVASVIFCFVSIFGATKYQSKFFTNTALASFSLTVLFLFAFIVPTNDIFMLCFTLFAAILILLENKIINATKNINDKYAILFSQFHIYSLINLSIASIYSFALCDFGILSSIGTSLCALLFLKGAIDERKNPSYIYVFFPLLLLGCFKITELTNLDVSIFYSTIIMLAVVAGSMFPIIEDNIQKLLRFGGSILSLLLFLLNATFPIFSQNWTLINVITSLLIFACVVFVSIKDKNVILFHLQSVLLILCIIGFMAILPELILAKELLCCILFAAAFSFYYYFKTPSITFRTITSDILFPIGCFINGVQLFYDATRFDNTKQFALLNYFSIFCFLISCFIILLLALEKKHSFISKIASYLAPHCFIAILLPIIDIILHYPNRFSYFDISRSVFLGYYFILTFIAIIGLLSQNKFTLWKRFTLPLFISVCLYGVVGTLMAYDRIDWYPLFVWALGIYLAVLTKTLYKQFPASTNSVISFYSSGITLLCASFFTLHQILYQTDLSSNDCFAYALIAPAAVAGIALVVSLLFAKTKAFLYNKLYTLSNFALYVLSVLMSTHHLYTGACSVYYAIICVAVCCFVYLSLRIRKNTIWCFTQFALFLPLVYDIADFFLPETIKYGMQYVTLGIFCSFAIISRLLYKTFYSMELVDNKKKLQIDWFAGFNIITPIYIISSGNQYWSFTGILLFALYVLLFLNRFPLRFSNRILYTITGSSLVIAFWAQPFLTIKYLYLAEWNLLPLILLGIAIQFIWKAYPHISKWALYAFSAIACIKLNYDVLVWQNKFDIIFLGSVALLLILYSFLSKQWVWYVLSGFSLVCCWWMQPIFKIPDILLLEYNLFAPIVYFIGSYPYWKERKQSYHQLNFLLALFSTLILIFDGIRSQEAIDVVIIGVLMLIMLIVSFIYKTKKWFLFSSFTMLGLAIYTTRTFWLSLTWWFYLLVAGILLITIAAINETSKQKGKGNLANKVNKLFGNWEW